MRGRPTYGRSRFPIGDEDEIQSLSRAGVTGNDFYNLTGRIDARTPQERGSGSPIDLGPSSSPQFQQAAGLWNQKFQQPTPTLSQMASGGMNHAQKWMQPQQDSFQLDYSRSSLGVNGGNNKGLSVMYNGRSLDIPGLEMDNLNRGPGHETDLPQWASDFAHWSSGDKNAFQPKIERASGQPYQDNGRTILYDSSGMAVPFNSPIGNAIYNTPQTTSTVSSPSPVSSVSGVANLTPTDPNKFSWASAFQGGQ